MTVRELREKLLEIPNQEMDAVKGLLDIPELGFVKNAVCGNADHESVLSNGLGEMIYNDSSVFHKEHYLPENGFYNAVKGYCVLLPIGEIKDGED